MMKLIEISMLSCLIAIGFFGCEKPGNPESASGMKDPDVITVFEVDTESNLKNPYMGWTLYSAFSDIPKAFWTKVDEAAEKYASTLYIRWTWADMEPEEGKYAWEYNDKFKQYVDGAIERGLRLCFRVYTDSYAQGKNASPEWVLGKAQCYPSGNFKTPYGDDPYFLEKYTAFIKAFGAKFNDPTIVDYVDSYGLGHSGEENWIQWIDPENSLEAHNRIVRAYEKAFDKVINVINFGVRNEQEEAVVYDELGFSSRRDGYCSKWFTTSDQIRFSGLFPKQMLVAEACYSSMTDFATTENGKWANWAEYSKDIIDLAINTHANYLDLRDATTTDRWIENNPEGVKLFLAKGGYRLYPAEVRYKYEENKLIVQHSWMNYGIGVLPNDNVHLRNKYKIALGIFDNDGNAVKKVLSQNAEVSGIIGDIPHTFTDEIDFNGIEAGQYSLGIAIINTIENDTKDIKLAVKNARLLNGEWLYAGDIDIR